MSIPSNAPAGANAPTLPNSETAPALAPSTVIQKLGLTFVEAEARITAGMEPNDLIGDDADAFSEEIADIAHAVHTTASSTISDAIVKLRVTTGPLGLQESYGVGLTDSVRQVTEFLERLHRGAAP